MKRATGHPAFGTLDRKESGPCSVDFRRKLPKEAVFSKMDKLMKEMTTGGTPLAVKTQRSLFSTVPNSFTGKDLAKWLQDHLHTDISEAQQLGLMLCHLGYICPVFNERDRSISFKADASLYRFQRPELWPSKKWETQGKDYAIYLRKKAERSAAGSGSGLEPYEQSALNSLQNLLPSEEWKRICDMAKNQAELLSRKPKADRETEELQEKTFWRLQRPPPGCIAPLEDYSGKRMHHFDSVRQKRKVDLLSKKITIYKKSIARSATPTSKAVLALMSHCEQLRAVDPLLDFTSRSNHWFIEDEDFWELQSLEEQAEPEDHLTAEQVQRWSFDLRELLRDRSGKQRFASFLKQQYSIENLHFWEACEELKRCPKSQWEHKVQTIVRTFLSADAPFEVNLNTSVWQKVAAELRSSPVSRFALEEAQRHIYQLMKDDCYPRFLRSEFYRFAVSETSASVSRHSRPSPAPERKSSFENGSSSSISSSGSSSVRSVRRTSPKPSSVIDSTAGAPGFTSPVVLRSHAHKSSSDRLALPSSDAVGRKLHVPAPAHHAASTSLLEVTHHRSSLHKGLGSESSHVNDYLASSVCTSLKKAGSLSSLHAGGVGLESDGDQEEYSNTSNDHGPLVRQSRHGSLRKMPSPNILRKLRI